MIFAFCRKIVIDENEVKRTLKGCKKSQSKAQFVKLVYFIETIPIKIR